MGFLFDRLLVMEGAMGVPLKLSRAGLRFLQFVETMKMVFVCVIINCVSSVLINDLY